MSVLGFSKRPNLETWLPLTAGLISLIHEEPSLRLMGG